MPKEIYEELDRAKFNALLQEGTHTIIIKFTAEWCKPCKTIKGFVDDAFGKLPDSILVFDLDIDDNFDIYAFMKTKKQVNGIPTMLCYKPGNTSIGADHSISGTDTNQIAAFLNQCVS